MAHIELKPHEGTVRVVWNQREIAASDAALDMIEGGGRPVIYVPREDADMGLFHKSAKTTHCPHKGDASYFTLKADGAVAADAVWSYEAPLDAVGAIRGYLAFYPDVVSFES